LKQSFFLGGDTDTEAIGIPFAHNCSAKLPLHGHPRKQRTKSFTVACSIEMRSSFFAPDENKLAVALGTLDPDPTADL